MIKNKNFYKAAALMSLLCASSTAQALLEDGDYVIRCHTRNGGKRALEAFPNEDVVRVRPASHSQDQTWSVKISGDGYYSISCETQNGGIRYLEAFPQKDLVRPRGEVLENKDQKWLLTSVKKNGYYRVSCATVNGGKRYLEAFPQQDVVRPSKESSDQDQIWNFIKQNKINPTVHPPLIHSTRPPFHINDQFTGVWRDILSLISTSYEIAKQHDKTIRHRLSRDQWRDLETFDGKNGWFGTADDFPGFIAYNEQKKLVAIIFHGSRNLADWTTNARCFSDEACNQGLKLSGSYHTGFLKKYKTCRKNLQNRLTGLINHLSQKEKEDLQFIVSGHSQGAALAHIASIDLAHNFLKKTYRNFDNTTHNKLYGWFLSYLPVTNIPWLRETKDTRKFYEMIVGKQNIFWYSVTYDLVSRVGFGSFKGPGYLGVEYLSHAVKKSLKIGLDELKTKFKGGDNPIFLLKEVISLFTIQGLLYHGVIVSAHNGACLNPIFASKMIQRPLDALKKGYFFEGGK